MPGFAMHCDGCAPNYSAPMVVLQLQCTSFRLPVLGPPSSPKWAMHGCKLYKCQISQPVCRVSLPVLWPVNFQSFFSHSVNCSDRILVKIDHGSVNCPPIKSIVRLFSFIFKTLPDVFSYATFKVQMGKIDLSWTFSYHSIFMWKGTRL